MKKRIKIRQLEDRFFHLIFDDGDVWLASGDHLFGGALVRASIKAEDTYISMRDIISIWLPDDLELQIRETRRMVKFAKIMNPNFEKESKDNLIKKIKSIGSDFLTQAVSREIENR